MREKGTARFGPVFYVSLALAIAFAGWGVLFRGSLSGTSTFFQELVVTAFG